MAKSQKLTDLELENVKKAVDSVRGITARVGELEAAKYSMIEELNKAQAQLGEERKLLEDKYGSISINIETGEYEEIVEEAETVEE